MESNRTYGLLAAILYGVCSTSMAFINKAVISSYGFNYPFFIMSCQMFVTILILEVLSHMKKIDIPNYTLDAGKSFALPSFAYGLHATLSLIALEGLNIPMYVALKRCTPIVNLVLSVIVLGKPIPSCNIILSILVITIGCVIAAIGALTVDMYAYTFGAMSVLAQGAYLTLVQKSSEDHKSTCEILLLNCYNTFGPFLILSIIAKEPLNIPNNIYITDYKFHVTFWSLAVLGSLLNYSLFLCTALNSALTTSIVGVAKSGLQTFIGFYAFGGVTVRAINMFGILLNLGGGVLYTWIRWHHYSEK